MEILCTAEYYASDVCAPYAVPPSCGCRARAIATTINAHLFNNGSIIVHILVSQLLFNLLRFIVFNRMPGIDTQHDEKSAKCIFFGSFAKQTIDRWIMNDAKTVANTKNSTIRSNDCGPNLLISPEHAYIERERWKFTLVFNRNLRCSI